MKKEANKEVVMQREMKRKGKRRPWSCKEIQVRRRRSEDRGLIWRE